MSNKAIETNIKTIVFSGKQEDWIAWKIKFLAKAERMGFIDLMTGEDKRSIPKSNAVLDPKTDADKIKIKELNRIGFSELVMSMETDKKNSAGFNVLMLINNSITDEYKRGNVQTAWNAILQRYEPDSAATLTKLTNQFFSFKLKQGADPEMYITNLETMRLRMAILKSTMTDEQFMTQILNNLTKDYATQGYFLEKRLNDKVNPLKIHEIRTELALQYERLGGKKSSDDNEVTQDQALYAGRNFKGQCRKCGQRGHKAAACPQRRGNRSAGYRGQRAERGPNRGQAARGDRTQNLGASRNNSGRRSGRENSHERGSRVSKGPCYVCGKMGHLARDCWY
jgi:hypothetical protein